LRLRNSALSTGRCVVTLTVLLCCSAVILGLTDLVHASTGEQRRRPEMDLSIVLSLPDTVAAGDTVTITMTFTLHSQVPNPEMGEGGAAHINRNPGGHGRLRWADNRPAWGDTLRVGHRYILSRRFQGISPGWVHFYGRVYGGIPYREPNDPRGLGVPRFRNAAICSTLIVGEALDLEGPLHLGIGPPPGKLPVEARVLERHQGKEGDLSFRETAFPLIRIHPTAATSAWYVNWEAVAASTHRQANDTVRMVPLVSHRDEETVFHLSGRGELGAVETFAIRRTRQLSFEFTQDTVLTLQHNVACDTAIMDTLWITERASGHTLLIPIRLYPAEDHHTD
jgi:hypothetical protein